MNDKCERCKDRKAEWVLYHAGAEVGSKDREEVCGLCIPQSAERVTNFAWRETKATQA
jgi:hypothetical protein